MVRAVRLAVTLVEPRLEEAARTLGAGPLRVWLTVTVPLSLPGILTGLVLAFARSLGEFGATVTFVGNVAGETRTLPLAIYTYTQIPGGDGPALRLVVISILGHFHPAGAGGAVGQRTGRPADRAAARKPESLMVTAIDRPNSQSIHPNRIY